MVTALALQLIQCVVRIPQPEEEEGQEELDSKDREARDKRRKAELVSDPREYWGEWEQSEWVCIHVTWTFIHWVP